MTVASALAGIPIATVAIRYEHDVVLARQRARLVAARVGFDAQEQVRFATAVSELARNAFQYAGGGRLQLELGREGDRSMLVARVRDSGPGIAELPRILAGEYKSATGMGVGILGARRLSDRFTIESAPGEGTCVSIGKIVAHARLLDAQDAASIADTMLRQEPASPYQELQQQNQELLDTLEALRASTTIVERLNQELEETNRGVVALYAELDDRAAELKRMSETKTRFLSDVSHELRTPLTSIVNLSRLLLSGVDGDLNEEQGKQVRLVEGSAKWLAEMVSDLLDIAKIEAGKVELRLGSFTTDALFAALRGMFRPLQTTDDVRLVFDDAAITLVSDEQRVAQVLRNFISNALKFTLAGEVRVGAVEQGINVVFYVRDTGAGIAPEDQGRIFEDYTQVDGPIQRTLRGTGLGLPLTRKLAALLGGSVSVDSEPGVGSTFSLVIPRVLEPEEQHG